MNDIGWAIAQLKAGKRVRRKVWSDQSTVRNCAPAHIHLESSPKGSPYILLTDVISTDIWQADQGDLLATDWEEVTT